MRLIFYNEYKISMNGKYTIYSRYDDTVYLTGDNRKPKKLPIKQWFIIPAYFNKKHFSYKTLISGPFDSKFEANQFIENLTFKMFKIGVNNEIQTKDFKRLDQISI